MNAGAALILPHGENSAHEPEFIFRTTRARRPRRRKGGMAAARVTPARALLCAKRVPVWRNEGQRTSIRARLRTSCWLRSRKRTS